MNYLMNHYAALAPLMKVLVKGCALIVLALGADFAFRKFHPAFRVALWRGAFVALCVMPIFYLCGAAILVSVKEAPASYSPLINTGTTEFGDVGEVTIAHEYSAPVASFAENPGGDTVVVTRAPAVAQAAFSSSLIMVEDSPLKSLPWGTILWSAYGAGLLIAAAALALQKRRLNALLKRGVATGASLREFALALAGRLEIRSGFTVLEASKLASPLVAGLRRPTVLLPEGREDSEQRGALAHELSHVAAGDLRWGFAFSLLEAVLWPNPLIWLLVARHRAAMEEAADLKASELLGSRETYVNTLARVALQAAEAGGNASAFPAIAMARRAEVTQRIKKLRGWSGRPLAMRTLYVFAAAFGTSAMILAATDVARADDNAKQRQQSSPEDAASAAASDDAFGSVTVDGTAGYDSDPNAANGGFGGGSVRTRKQYKLTAPTAPTAPAAATAPKAPRPARMIIGPGGQIDAGMSPGDEAEYSRNLAENSRLQAEQIRAQALKLAGDIGVQAMRYADNALINASTAGTTDTASPWRVQAASIGLARKQLEIMDKDLAEQLKGQLGDQAPSQEELQKIIHQAINRAYNEAQAQPALKTNPFFQNEMERHFAVKSGPASVIQLNLPKVTPKAAPLSAEETAKVNETAKLSVVDIINQIRSLPANQRDNANIQWAALRQIAASGKQSTEVVEKMTKLLDDKDLADNRLQVISVLGECRAGDNPDPAPDPAALPALNDQLLYGANAGIRSAAARAIGKQHPNRVAMKYLRDARGSEWDESVRQSIENSLNGGAK